MFEMHKPEYRQLEYEEAEEKLYFTADDMIAGHALTLWDMRRNISLLEREGFFVENDSSLSWKNWLRVENRLIRTEAHSLERWFNPDGRMITCCDEVINKPPRPAKSLLIQSSLAFNQRDDDELALSLHKPTKAPDLEGMALSNEILQLVFTFHSLNLFEHSLMTEEIRKAKSIQDIIGKIQQRKSSKLIEYLEGRVIAHQLAYRDYVNSQDSSKAGAHGASDEYEDKHHVQLLNHLQAIRSAKAEFELESRNDRLLEWRLLKLWDNLKQIRSTQNFSSSSLRLVVQQTPVDVAAAEEHLRAYIDSEVWERKQLTEVRLYLNGISSGIDEGGDETPNKRRNRRNRTQMSDKRELDTNNEQSMFADIKESLASCFRPAGIPILEFKSVFDHPVTRTSDCPSIEQSRRSHVESTTMSLRLMVDERETFASPTVPIRTDDFSVNFSDFIQSNVTLRTKSMPKSLKIELHEQGTHGDSLLGECVVDIPGIGKMNQTLNQEVQACKFEGTSFKMSTAFDSYVREHEAGNHIRSKSGHFNTTSGIFYTTVAWDEDWEGKALAPVELLSKISKT
eukprot:Partr_v1_DN28831_c0_g1_i5_m33931 putative coiled-coil and C2 domain containing